MYYQWQENGASISGATSSSFTIVDAQPSDQGSYSVKIVNGGGSVTSSSATLTVDVPAGITTQPQSQAVTQGQNVSFTVVASGTAPISYQWYLNGSSLGSTGTSSTLTLNGVTATNAGSYTVVVQNSWGSVTSAMATLTVYVPAGIQTQPTNLAVIRGQNASFSVVASGTAPLNYQWNFDGSALSAATNATLSLTNVQSNQAGSYAVVVTNSWGSVTSAVASLTVDIPPSIMTQPQSQVVTQGQNVSFSVAACGTKPLSYHWKLNGSALSAAATNATLSLTNVQSTQAGSYTVVVTNSWGSVTSAVASLTVDVPAGIQTQPTNLTVTQGQNASFSVVASGTAPLSYQWNLNGAALSAATNATLSLTNVQSNQAGSYTVMVTNSWGSVTSAVASLTVDVPPTIATQPQSQAVTQGQSVSFSVVASGTSPLSYQWYDNGSPVGGNNATLTLNNVHTNQTGNYTVVVKNTWGSATSAVASLTVDVPAGIQTQPGNVTVTQGQNASFSVVASGTAPFTYQWNLDGSALSTATNASLSLINVQSNQAGSYTVVVTNSWGSVTSAVATLTVDVPPSITTQPQSQVVAHDLNVSFSVVAIGTSPLSYQWYDNGSSVGGNNATLTLNNVHTNQSGSYTVVVKNNWGSVTSAVAVLAVYIPPGIQTQPGNLTVTQGQNASFSVVSSGSAPFSYQWSFGGAALSGATNGTLSLTNVQSNQAGSYTVVVTNPVGSVTSQVATLTVDVPPTITTQPYGQAVTRHQNVSFSVGANGTTPFSYQWFFNGLSLGATGTSSTLTLDNVYAGNAGSYTVVMQNSYGSITSAVATLTVTNPNVTLYPAVGAGTVSNGFSFQFSVPVGYTYVILASTDFQTWTPIATNVVTIESNVFTDIAATNNLNRFYRAMLQ